MQANWTTSVSLMFSILVYLGISTASFWRLKDHLLRFPLVWYGLVAALFNINLFALQQNWFVGTTVNDYARSAIIYQPYILALFFLNLSYAFLGQNKLSRRWWQGAIAWLLIVIFINVNVIGLPEILFAGMGQEISRLSLVITLLTFGWTISLVIAIHATIQTLLTRQQPLHRNRTTYWALSLFLFFVGSVFLLLNGQLSLHITFNLVSAVIVMYVVFTYQLADVRQIVRLAASYLILAVVGVLIYSVGWVGVNYFLSTFSPVLSSALLAFLLALLINPLHKLISRLIDYLLVSSEYDANQIVSEYSKNVSSIVDLQKLEAVAINLISNAMNIRYGSLLLVDEVVNKESKRLDYEIRSVQSYGMDKVVVGQLADDSPILAFWREEHRPLTQFEIDMNPRFRALVESGEEWLLAQEIDVYVPIISQDKWLGLLALGPKISRQRYYDEDLQVLTLMADQTAVALKNARLVEDLVLLNDELTNAFYALESANQKLQERDNLKASFLSVITHEMRTPFANLTFSKQLFERYGLENMEDEQQEVWGQVSIGIDEAKKLVDNLVTFASFLSKQGKLVIKDIVVADLIETTLLPLYPMADRKQLQYKVEIQDRIPTIQADVDRLQDAIHHLVHNAIKFTEQGQILIQVWVNQDRFNFEVQDTGVGIPAEQLEFIWKGFNQMADAIRRGVEGLGVGLALVYTIVEGHGGDVWVHSEEGKGSMFGFWIPTKQHNILKSLPSEEKMRSLLQE